jgi:hypothetical protein
VEVFCLGGEVDFVCGGVYEGYGWDPVFWLGMWCLIIRREYTIPYSACRHQWLLSWCCHGGICLVCKFIKGEKTWSFFRDVMVSG